MFCTGGAGEESLEARKNCDSIITDAEGVSSAQEAIAASFQDFEVALCPPSVGPAAHLDDAVHHCVFRNSNFGIIPATGQQEHGAIRYGGQSLKFVNELLELHVRACGFLGSDQPVKHQQRSLGRTDFLTEHGKQATDPFGFQHRKSAEIGDLVRDQATLEEGEIADVLQHSRVGLGEERHIQGSPAGCCMVKAQLIAEDRLPRAGLPLDDGDAALQESTIQYDIQTFDPAWHLRQPRAIP